MLNYKVRVIAETEFWVQARNKDEAIQAGQELGYHHITGGSDNTWDVEIVETADGLMANYEVEWVLKGSEYIEDADSEDEAEDRAREYLYEYGGSWAKYDAVLTVMEAPDGD